ncbi:MAG: hypothetical protein ACYSUD_00320, partial [Planctomycetota bacterium]
MRRSVATWVAAYAWHTTSYEREYQPGQRIKSTLRLLRTIPEAELLRGQVFSFTHSRRETIMNV